MTSIFQRVMGSDFDRLHPMLQRRFGVGLETQTACIGTGVMSSVRRGPWWTVPFLQLGRFRNILVPDVGTDVPFTIENYPYLDPLGRETITFVRSYQMRGKQRRFDATMIAEGGRVIDYLGTRQHLAVELDPVVHPDGGVTFHTGQQRFYLGPVDFNFPMIFSGHGQLSERYDDEAEQFEVNLEVTNKRFGFLFGYRGTFTCEWIPATDAPDRLKPARHEKRVPPQWLAARQVQDK